MAGLLNALRFKQQAAPSTPASGTLAVYGKTDDYIYQMDDGGVEKRIRTEGPFARLYASAATTGLARNASQKVAINTANEDSHSGFNSVNNRYVFPWTGWYRVSFVARGSTFSTVTQSSNFEGYIALNGGATDRYGDARSPVVNTGDVISVNGSDLIEVTATTDYVELFTMWTNGTAGTTYTQAIISGITPSLSITYERPL